MKRSRTDLHTRLASALLAGVGLTALAAASAFAQVPVGFEVETGTGVTRLELAYPESEGGDLSAEVEIVAGSVLIARLSEPASGDAESLVNAAPGLIARARLDPDGQVLRVALNRAVTPRVSVSHNLIAIDLMEAGATPLADIVSSYEAERRRAEAERARQAAAAAAAAAAPPPPTPLTIEWGQASEYTRIEFVWEDEVSYTLETDGGRAQLSFSRPGETDLGGLLGTPPRLVEAVSDESDARRFALEFRLEPGVRAQAWQEEPDRVVLDLLDPVSASPMEMLGALTEYADAQAAAATEAEARENAPDVPDDAPEVYTEEARPDPVPESGIVPVTVRSASDALSLSFNWADLPGAAVFRRADAIWLVFDAAAEIDLGELSAANRSLISGYESWTGPDYTAVRFVAPASTLADVSAAGSTWMVSFVEALAEPPRAVRLTRETRFDAPARIAVALEGARSVREIRDPVVGDTLHVITAAGENRGVLTGRRLVEAVFLPSAHGVAIEPLADDLEIARVPGGAVIGRPGGLALSRGIDPSTGRVSARPVSPAFLDLAGWRAGDDYREARRRLERQASQFEPDALLALARFFLSWQLASEAMGVADLAEEARPQLADTPEMLALRGAASFMMGRYQQAQDYFTNPVLANEASVQPWLGLIAAEQGRWTDARRHFEAGQDVLFFFTPHWRGRVHAAQARAAVETNDIGAARALLDVADSDGADLRQRAEVEFARARLAAATGDHARAIARFEELGASQYEPIQVPALLEKVRLEIANDRISPAEGAEVLESLRYRWRGDRTEVETARLLGELYGQAGRYGEAFRIWEAARQRHPDGPIARTISADMDDLFRRLFLDNEADALAPLDALSLWYEYDYLTPQGEEGDRLVRRIAARLEAVDLLDQAASLLAHQIEERDAITGYAKAQIAVDLARLYLIANRPEDALRTIQSTRIARLPDGVVEARRLLEARALADLGRHEHALELIGGERSAEAEILRAGIAWDMRDWSGAGRRFEAVHSERWREPEPLEPGEAHDILRAAIAYALADDTSSVERLEARYARQMGETAFGSAFSLITSEVGSAGDARLVDLVSELGSMDGVDSFLAGFTRRFRDDELIETAEAS